jgi:hypothetical protein
MNSCCIVVILACAGQALRLMFNGGRKVWCCVLRAGIRNVHALRRNSVAGQLTCARHS